VKVNMSKIPSYDGPTCLYSHPLKP
jgi:hypothetical protein